MMQRPLIQDIQTGQELKQWYWLKEELVTFAKQIDVSYVGSKFEILDRLAANFDGKNPDKQPFVKNISKFDWSKATLNLETIITDSYTNGPNSRKLFKEHCGNKFSFSIPFMVWMKENVGKTLGDAIDEWNRLQQKSKDKDFQSVIPTGNQYNQYLRDIFKANPGLSMAQARFCWQQKRRLPLERHVYEDVDLKVLEQ